MMFLRKMLLQMMIRQIKQMTENRLRQLRPTVTYDRSTLTQARHRSN